MSKLVEWEKSANACVYNTQAFAVYRTVGKEEPAYIDELLVDEGKGAGENAQAGVVNRPSTAPAASAKEVLSSQFDRLSTGFSLWDQLEVKRVTNSKPKHI